MAKKPHPADIYLDKEIARCVHFSAYFRKGPLETYHSPAATLQEAQDTARRLNEEHGKASGRRACVYGVTPEGTTYPIGERYWGRRQSA